VELGVLIVGACVVDMVVVFAEEVLDLVLMVMDIFDDEL
jgi:hypothetical protein